MATTPRKTDRVRASRDGHEYHEAWTAREAMQLLLGKDGLIGIAVEGLDPDEQTRASPETVEIADLTLYYGQGTGFEHADKVDVVQFKYSPSRENTDFRASDAKKTVAKFAASYCDYKSRYSARQVEDKLRFELITNRPIYPPLVKAVRALAAREAVPASAVTQAVQFKLAAGLDGEPLAEFAGKFQISGRSGSLADTKRSLSMIVADWSATSDALAMSRLGAMRDMVRSKAGSPGTGRNIIRDTDVLAALEIPDKEALLPCPASLPEVGEVVEREQLPYAVALIPTLSKPLLIHAAGGVGKTVFMQSLGKSLEDRYEVVFFDCFGGGAYRSPEDARHLPKRGLIHIANSLACRGLCDPILPNNDDLETLLKTFRRRLEQSIRTLLRASPKRELALLLDAIDNAAEHARDRHEESFPNRLLESLQHAPVSGLRLVASSRSHRIPVRHIPYEDFRLRPFSFAETASYLRARLTDVTDVELHVAQARSDGNPRILEYLVNSGRGVLDPSESENKIELTALIERRLERALSEAMNRGYSAKDTDAFLAGLAVLPPPVPLGEYAEAQGMPLPAIESFVSDLWPLLERTKHGLMFRDEPTETLVKDKYASVSAPLQRVASNLLGRQDRSVYAARALPELLQKLGDGEQLFTLAFDDRFPAAITSTVGKRNIRYARLKAAARYTANAQDYDRLVHLLLELSTIAAVDRRGADYILDSPDLVIAAGDPDATRRLFETHTAWQGTRHARLTIAHTLSGDLDEASRHLLRTRDWLNYYWQHDNDPQMRREGPASLDIAAIPFFLISQNRNKPAISFLRRWKEWYAYEVGELLFGLLQQRAAMGRSTTTINGFLDVLTKEVGCIASALSFLELPRETQKKLIMKLARGCVSAKKLETDNHFRQGPDYRLQDGLRKASAISMSLRLYAKAAAIAKCAPHNRPNTWSFSDRFSTRDVFPFLFHVALTSALKGRKVRGTHIVPAELLSMCNGIKANLTGVELQKELKKRLEKRWRASREDADTDEKAFTYEQKSEAERFIDKQLLPLTELTNAFAGLLRAPIGKADKAFRIWLKKWSTTRSAGDYYYRTQEYSRFFEMIGRDISTFALWARSDLRIGSARAFVQQLHKQEVVPLETLIQIVSIMAKRKPLQTLAGEEAIKARHRIETENEVTYKVSLYAKLARAILHASVDEAVAYFRTGLDQMDAIGSGDWEFTNELLLFASSLRGQELDERDFHTLTNICELNLTDEPEKFPWFAFGKAMSRVSGCRGLAKLSRWDDRSKAPLRYTLLPYLIALVEDGKIPPEDALALNRLARPVEFHVCNTETLANTIANKHYPNAKPLILELITQFEENYPGASIDSITKPLAGIAKNVLGETSTITRRLSRAHLRLTRIRHERNEYMNYRGRRGEALNTTSDVPKTAEFKKIVRRTNPIDETSLAEAIASLDNTGNSYLAETRLLERLRASVTFNQRPHYLRALSNLENINLYVKLEELQKCKLSWRSSSAALTDAYKALALPLLRLHADDMLSAGYFSGYKLKDISQLSGMPIARLALELVRLYAERDSSVPASVWLALASFISDVAREGEGQAALKRLLSSQAAKLSSTVMDGEWKDGIYPGRNGAEIAAAFVWRMLGSPYAADRWQAAHSVRRFAKFGRGNVLDVLVGKFDKNDASTFQAPELRFYYMHARLWLLIALARLALDDPRVIAKYKDTLLAVVQNKYGPHVLMRHFAGRALIACIDAAEIKVPAEAETLVKSIDCSPMPRLKERLKHHDDPYTDRPAGASKPKIDFSLDYDFRKYDVQSLSDVFGRPSWEVADCLSEIVRNLDSKVVNMYEPGGREVRYQYRGGMTSRFHTYGQQLGWHALQLVAGEFLSKYPVTSDWFYDEPWNEWLGRYLLTRSDGLWLADGMDRVPLDVIDNLLEREDQKRAITGDKTKLLRLAGLESGVPDQITVSGFWYSADNVEINISSVLAPRRSAARVVKGLLDEAPVLVWLPQYGGEDDGDNYLPNEKPDCVPWVVRPAGEAKLDEDDPLSSVLAVHRPRIAKRFASLLSLRPADPFGRVWTNLRGRIVARTQAWGRENEHGEDSTQSGNRLVCSRGLLGKILKKNDADLLILIKLQRSEREYAPRSSTKFSHTVAVIRLTKSLDIKHYKGRVNYPFTPRF